jgi:hypothetical protein
MHINLRSIAQKVNSRISGGISREIKGLNEENRTWCKGFTRWKDICVIFKTAGAYSQNRRPVDRYMAG